MPSSGQASVTRAKVARSRQFLVRYFSCLIVCFCRTTVSTIMNISVSGAVMYHVIVVYQFFVTCTSLNGNRLELSVIGRY